MDDCEMYEIQYIFGSQILNNKVQYCVKWKNYPKTQKTWEPVENLGVHNMSSARRYQRHADYTLFYKHVYEGKVDGYRIHQKANLLEKIKVQPEEDDDEEVINNNIEQANTDKINKEPELDQIQDKSLNSKSRASRASRNLKLGNSDNSASNSKDSEYGKKSKKSQSKAKSRSKKRSPQANSNGAKLLANGQSGQNLKVKKEYIDTDEIQQPLVIEKLKQNGENEEKPIPQQQIQTKPKPHQKNIELIKSAGYFNQLRSLINQFSETDKSKINSLVAEKQKDNSFELLGALVVFDRLTSLNEIFSGFQQQLQEVPLILPPKKLQEDIEKKSSKRKQKQEKSIAKLDQSQRSTDIANKSNYELRKTVPFNQSNKKVKGNLRRNTEEPPAMSDFLATMNNMPQFGLVHTAIDENKDYGQIGFQRGDSIQGHLYAVNVSDIGKPEICLYFIMAFRREGEKTFLFNWVTKKQALEYEQDLVYSYVDKNRDLLPELYNELFQQNVYNQ